jgi:5'(3')-deoxyribonucleotidase
MKKPIIAVDIDDVLASSTDALRVAVNNRLGVTLPPEAYMIESDYWGYYDAVWEANGLSGRISLDELDAQMRKDQSHIAPMPGAFAALSQMQNDYDFIVVTARSSKWAAATHAWLQANFPDIFHEVIFAEGLEGIREKSKGDLCLEAGAHWLIDDNIEHALSALELGVLVVVFGEYGWHYKGIPDGVVACKNWLDIGGYFSARN